MSEGKKGRLLWERGTLLPEERLPLGSERVKYVKSGTSAAICNCEGKAWYWWRGSKWDLRMKPKL